MVVFTKMFHLQFNAHFSCSGLRKKPNKNKHKWEMDFKQKTFIVFMIEYQKSVVNKSQTLERMEEL